MVDLQDRICDMLREVLPNGHEKLQIEYKELLLAVFERKKGPTECLQFISTVEDSLYDGTTMTIPPKQVLLVRHLFLNLREQFLDNGDAVDFLLGRLEMLEVRKRELPVNTPHLVDAHCLIADLLRRSAQIDESVENYQQAKVLLQHCESTELKSAEAVVNAGLACINFQKGGSEDVTSQYFETASVIVREHILSEQKYLGRENAIMRIQALVAIKLLTDILCLRKKYDAMETLLKLALPIAQAESELEESRILSWMVYANALQKKNEEMLKFVMKASDTIQKIRNKKSISRSKTIRRMIEHHRYIAKKLYKTGSKERSIAYTKNILDLAKEVFGERHPLVANECVRLACFCFGNNDRANADIYKEMAEDILSGISSDPSNERFRDMCIHEILDTYAVLGHYYQVAKDYKSAKRHFGDGLELCMRMLRDFSVPVIKFHTRFDILHYYCKFQKQSAIKCVKIT